MSDALLHLGTAPSNEHATSRVLPVAEAIRVWPATDLGFHNETPQDKLGEELLSPISGNLRIWGKGDVPPAAFQKKKKKKTDWGKFMFALTHELHQYFSLNHPSLIVNHQCSLIVNHQCHQRYLKSCFLLPSTTMVQNFLKCLLLVNI